MLTSYQRLASAVGAGIAVALFWWAGLAGSIVLMGASAFVAMLSWGLAFSACR